MQLAQYSPYSLTARNFRRTLRIRMVMKQRLKLIRNQTINHRNNILVDLANDLNLIQYDSSSPSLVRMQINDYFAAERLFFWFISDCLIFLFELSSFVSFVILVISSGEVFN